MEASTQGEGMTYGSSLYHYHFGIHSNIPKCCVAYYLTKDDGHRGEGLDYIRCPECKITNSIQKIHRCVRGCIPFLRSIGVSTCALSKWNLKEKL